VPAKRTKSRVAFAGSGLASIPAVSRTLAVLIFAAASGCLGPAPELGESQAAITGGTTDANDPAIVLLYVEDGAQAFVCTASVIAPKVLLTAAHCVSSDLHSASAKYSAYLRADLGQVQPGDLRPAAEVHAQPSWDINNLPAGHDLGVVILRDAVTVTPLPLRRSPLASSDVGQTLRLVGYGASDGTTLAGIGIKRQTTTGLDAFDDATLTYQDPTHLTCNGDSGGPALLSRDGVEEIAGVTSYGDQKCKQFGVDSRVDADLAFIDGYVSQADASTSAPADLSGMIDAGTVDADPMNMTHTGAAPHHGCSLGGARPDGAGWCALAVLGLALALRRSETRRQPMRRSR
jgi:V8-like Glu-specific endopeptidase